ncbi:hypothetical protein HY628_02235 [Candidatus Uhrbacteria bacterium]|nr:hypothetical protein [Candidatus Uhrbacteria bacterium]
MNFLRKSSPLPAALLLASFISIAVFGSFMMGHGNAHAAPRCVIASTQSASCPDSENAFAFLAFHITALRDFSAATPLEAGLFPLLVLLFFIFWASRLFSLQQLNLSSFRAHFRKNLCRRQRRLKHWLALLEHSPTIV